MHEAKYLPSTKLTYSQTGFHNSQASYFNTKVLVFAEPGHMQLFETTANLTHMIKSVIPSVTTATLPVTCSSRALYKDHVEH